MSRIRLDRLMKKLPDGSYKVVGYQEAALMPAITSDKKIEQLMGWLHSYDGDDWFHPTSFTRIPHDRIDQYVVKIGDNNIFEKDEVILTAVNDYFSNNNINIKQGGEFVGVVRYLECFWGVYQEDNSAITFSDIINDEIEFTKITGIEGVSSKNINTGG